MFRRLRNSDDEDDESSSNTPSSNNMLVNIGRFLNVSAIGVLYAISVLLSLQVASEQKQIDELKKTIEQSNSDIQIEVEKQKDLTIVNIAGTFTLLSCIVTMFHMSSHLKKMNQPFVQRKIMAIQQALGTDTHQQVKELVDLMNTVPLGGRVADTLEKHNWAAHRRFVERGPAPSRDA